VFIPAKRLLGVKASPTLAITSLAKQMIKDGKSVVNLAAGEPDFDTADAIKTYAKKAIDNGFTKYTAASGTLELKKAIAAKFLGDNKLSYSQDEIVVSCGAKHSLFNTFQVLCNPGDEVLLMAPYWVSYPEMIRMAGAKPVIVKTKESEGFKVDFKTLKKSVSKKTKAIILNSPSNPVGTVYDLKDIERIAEIALSSNIFVISDEIYEKLIYDKSKHISIGSLGKDVQKMVITINGVSKSYAMTGWRIGYLGADAAITKSISVLQSHSTSNPASISQKAALEALKIPATDLEEMRVKFENRRNCMMNRLDELSVLTYIKPGGAFYIFCNIKKTGLKASDFARKLLEEKCVAVIPGEAFGSDEHIRLSFATDITEINQGIDRIKEWLKQ